MDDDRVSKLLEGISEPQPDKNGKGGYHGPLGDVPAELIEVMDMNEGTSNGNWKGGITITNRGYRKVLTKGHPRADRDGYVLEHVLVMEEVLGRKLRKGEVVHHLNRDKLDNRPENLELCASQAEHLKHHHARLGKLLVCPTCGTEFYRSPSRVRRKFNFCKQSCVRPHLWESRWGKHRKEKT